MKIFLDTANIEDIEYYRDFIDGVTTNPTILSAFPSKNHKSMIQKICNLVRGQVSVEVVSEKPQEMLKEAHEIAKIHEKICVKLPCTYEGLKICKQLSNEGIATNLTLCFSATQAILAAKCGATYVSPFIGRLDDTGSDGLTLIEEVYEIYRQNGYETNILAASVRNIYHVIQSAIIGVDAITMSPKILKNCMEHSLTDKGLKIFAEDWNKEKNAESAFSDKKENSDH